MFNISKMISHPEIASTNQKASRLPLHNGPLGEIYAGGDMPEDEQQILRYCLEWSDDFQGCVPPERHVAGELNLPLIKTGLCMLYHADFLKSYAHQVAAVMRPCPPIFSKPISKN